VSQEAEHLPEFSQVAAGAQSEVKQPLEVQLITWQVLDDSHEG